jgi:membrane-bound serine protease (ClpP class)
MIDKTKELRIDGETLNKEGNLLTLTDQQAAKEYGQPPKRLLSAGTVDSLDQLFDKLGVGAATKIRLEPTGAEHVGAWLVRLAPLLLVIGVVGIWIEIKTPGFGLPGIIGIVAFGLYFLGGYAAGLSGWEWVIVFFLGLLLVVLELFVFPGTIIIGLVGGALMLAAIVMALVDLYPNPGPGLPSLPSFEVSPFTLPLRTILIALGGSAVAVWLASLWLPKTPLYHTIVSGSVSGGKTEATQEQRKREQLGRSGVTVSTLRPGGKAKFGEEIMDVVAQGEFIPPNTPVKVVDFNGTDPVVVRA